MNETSNETSNLTSQVAKADMPEFLRGLDMHSPHYLFNGEVSALPERKPQGLERATSFRHPVIAHGDGNLIELASGAEPIAPAYYSVLLAGLVPVSAV